MTEQIRKKRYVRAVLDKTTEITDRDIAILKSIYDFRLLNSAQIQALNIGNDQYILRRLQELFHKGFVSRPKSQIMRYQSGSRKMVYGIGDDGARLLFKEGLIPKGRYDWHKKNEEAGQIFIEHTILIADIIIPFILSCKEGKVRFITPTEILSNTVIKPKNMHKPFYFQVNTEDGLQGIIPDYAFGLEYEGGGKSYFFIEADRGTMPIKRTNKKQTSFAGKIDIYRVMYFHKLHEELFKFKNFRVITVTDTPVRAKNMVQAVKDKTEGNGSNMFLFADIKTLQGKNPLEFEFISGKGEVVKLGL